MHDMCTSKLLTSCLWQYLEPSNSILYFWPCILSHFSAIVYLFLDQWYVMVLNVLTALFSIAEILVQQKVILRFMLELSNGKTILTRTLIHDV